MTRIPSTLRSRHSFSVWLTALFLSVVAAPVLSQSGQLFPVLTIDQDRLFSETRLGAKKLEALEQAAQELAAENNAIETELIGEERRLTEQRSTLQAQEFRTLADEFDQRVQRIRQEQDEKARDLTRTRDEARAAFFKEVAAIISDIVREKGALVVIDRRDVFLSADRIDITDEAIQRVNEAEGLTVE